MTHLLSLYMNISTALSLSCVFAQQPFPGGQKADGLYVRDELLGKDIGMEMLHEVVLY